jgi:hypothetical protein
VVRFDARTAHRSPRLNPAVTSYEVDCDAGSGDRVGCFQSRAEATLDGVNQRDYLEGKSALHVLAYNLTRVMGML